MQIGERTMNTIEKIIKEENFKHEPVLNDLSGYTIKSAYHHIPSKDGENFYTCLILEDNRPLSNVTRKLLIDNNGLTYVTDEKEIKE